MAAGIKEIGKRLGLSPSTVSRVLNNKQVLNDKGVPFISKKTREKVLKAAQEMGYQPHMAARALVRGETRRIAFWVPRMGHRYFQEIAYHFQQILMAADYEMIMGEIGPNMLKSDHAGLARVNVDGAIIYGGLLNDELRNELESRYSKNTPIVNMGARFEGSLDYVKVEFYPATCQAVQHLRQMGCQRIGYLTTEDSENDLNDPHRRAYTDTLKAWNQEAEIIVTSSWDKKPARETVVKYVKAHGHPDALLCANDDLAIGAMRGLRDLGLSIPTDVAIIGSDGIEETEYFYPPITTIIVPEQQLCEIAWEMLHRRINNPTLPQQQHTVTTTLAIRASSSK